MKNKIAYISGHLNITDKEFEEHYVPQLDEAIARNCIFVVCDAKGVDLKSQKYLLEKNYPTEKVIVYHMFDEPRNNLGFPTRGGYQNDTERDCFATITSEFDILWVRPGKENSGTAENKKRRILVDRLFNYDDTV